jgi:tRNA (cmo5U34)-methyltransferase
VKSNTPSYRWNTPDAALAYDQAAPAIHPHYHEMQDQILAALPFAQDERFSMVDLGGGSGRFLGRCLQQFSQARGFLIDQSAAFLALAQQRLAPFGQRASLVSAKLQSDWATELSEPPRAIVSMSAIHHLGPAEKCDLYGRCRATLADDGVFLTGDEFRPADDDTYLQLLTRWARHMQSALANGAIPASFRATLDQWYAKNIETFGSPKQSGDDFHETAAIQQQYLLEAGFATAEMVWGTELWGVLYAAGRRDHHT